ncbi:MAG: N-succinylarginine dihydrolase, partial [Planctomycetota bacterium]
VHDPLLATTALADEGAANHTRLAPEHDGIGIETFVYGRAVMQKGTTGPRKFPARQTLESCKAIARRHGLSGVNTFFIQQTPEAIDAGVFHNDVISVGNANVLLCHEKAFVAQAEVVASLKDRFSELFGSELFVIEFGENEIPLADAVTSYLFNSQLLSRKEGGMTLVCPLDCKETPTAFACTQRLLAEENPVDAVEFLDLRQSMNNGGGPACLRLRVVLTSEQEQALHAGVVFTDSLHERLVQWVKTHYREQIAPADLGDISLYEEARAAMIDLAGILELPEDVIADA